jgi:hypothetical protein
MQTKMKGLVKFKRLLTEEYEMELIGRALDKDGEHDKADY